MSVAIAIMCAIAITNGRFLTVIMLILIMRKSPMLIISRLI
jgi:hypothetical protein